MPQRLTSRIDGSAGAMCGPQMVRAPAAIAKSTMNHGTGRYAAGNRASESAACGGRAHAARMQIGPIQMTRDNLTMVAVSVARAVAAAS